MAGALSRMESSGESLAGFLNIFQDRGVDVIGMLGRRPWQDPGEIYDMISGVRSAAKGAVDIIQKGLDRYAGSMDQMAPHLQRAGVHPFRRQGGDGQRPWRGI